jgi:hypothetical protein
MTKKILFLTMLALLLTGGRSYAQGYMSVKLGASAQFVYVQVVNVLDGHFLVHTDVTGKVPHALQEIDGQKSLIIN